MVFILDWPYDKLGIQFKWSLLHAEYQWRGLWYQLAVPPKDFFHFSTVGPRGTKKLYKQDVRSKKDAHCPHEILWCASRHGMIRYKVPVC